MHVQVDFERTAKVLVPRLGNGRHRGSSRGQSHCMYDIPAASRACSLWIKADLSVYHGRRLFPYASALQAELTLVVVT